jgi:hypothetical protein
VGVDLVQERRQGGAGGVWTARPRVELRRIQEVGQHAQRLPGGDAERLELGGQAGCLAVPLFLEQQLAVAQDVVQRRAQLVAQVTQRFTRQRGRRGGRGLAAGRAAG